MNDYCEKLEGQFKDQNEVLVRFDELLCEKAQKIRVEQIDEMTRERFDQLDLRTNGLYQQLQSSVL
jgi:hypothetical protein